MDMQIFRFITLCVLLIGCEGLHTLGAAQAHNTAPLPKKAGSHGYCLYSQGTGPVNSPLMIAIWQGNTERVSKMIESEKDLNKTFSIACHNNEDGDIKTTPLLNAIRGGHSEMVKLLLCHGANPLFRADPNWNPLLAAVSYGNVAIVRLLLQHGAIVDDRAYDGETPLMQAAQRPNTIAVINELIAAKADIHAVDKLGNNAVMLAAWQHRPEVVKLLVELGGDGCAKNDDGETAIDQARSLNEDPGKHEIIAFLQEKCGRQ
jgi:ankyrin repeat protein